VNSLKKVFNVIKELTKVNLIKTIYFNYSSFPFYIASRLPILFYGKVKFKDLSGKVNIDSTIVKFGIIKFGGSHEIVVSSNSPTELLIKGNITFTGSATFGQGTKIVIWENGNLICRNNFSLGSNSHIVSFRRIEFGSNVLISWNCNFYDTDFHFIKNASTNEVADNCKEVSIGSNTWIGSHVTVLKGTKLPNEIVIGSNSVCSSDYSLKINSKSIIAGNPAKLIKEDFVYILDKREESVLFKKYIGL
jgi:acetyltransferase-like isoleucine patch superfamily enzyme